MYSVLRGFSSCKILRVSPITCLKDGGERDGTRAHDKEGGLEVICAEELKEVRSIEGGSVVVSQSPDTESQSVSAGTRNRTYHVSLSGQVVISVARVHPPQVHQQREVSAAAAAFTAQPPKIKKAVS